MKGIPEIKLVFAQSEMNTLHYVDTKLTSRVTYDAVYARNAFQFYHSHTHFDTLIKKDKKCQKFRSKFEITEIK